MTPPPTAIGLILCEKVIIEEGSRRLTFVNSFTKLITLLADGDWVAQRRLRLEASS